MADAVRVPDRFQVEALAVIQRDLLAIAKRLGQRAYRLGVRKAEMELGLPDLFDPRGQAFVVQFDYRSIRSLTARTSIMVEDLLREGIREGVGVDDLTKRLDEALEGRVATVATIARTEANRAANWGRFNGWKRSGIVKRKECIATLDDRVREDHLEAHGEVVGLDSVFTRGAAAGKQAPPWDPNCRCTIAPVTSFTETNQDRTEVPADVEQADALRDDLDLAVKRHGIPGLIGFEDEAAAEMAATWRAGAHRLVEVVREANR